MKISIEPRARRIAGDIMTRTRDALISGDYEAFGSCFLVPFTLFTDLGETEVTSHEQNEEIFQRVRWHYKALGVTRIERRLLASQFFKDDTILSVHEAKLFRDGALVQEPFRVMSTLVECGDVWKITDNRYAVEGSLRFNRALYGPKPPEKQDAACIANSISGAVVGLPEPDKASPAGEADTEVR